MNPTKKNIIAELISTYDIKTAKDIQEALKDLLGETLQDMLESEMNEHLGINKDGLKEALGMYVGDGKSSKYWLTIFNELKNRGLKDIIILCADGLSGIKESINVAFPNTEYQRCIVHQVRNTLKYVSYKDKK
ncbi:Transposase, Mutator family [Peptostreptococcus sp. D1]|nr:Transposase, Mutator family [Peptostreptococcus sp. D1]